MSDIEIGKIYKQNKSMSFQKKKNCTKNNNFYFESNYMDRLPTTTK